MKKKHRILVVDDSPTVRRLVTLTLTQGGYDVLSAENGEIGFETAQREKPAAILVDFVMPRMNGFEFCKKVRSDPHLTDIPIVLITSKGKEVGKGFAENFHISHYLQKPFEPKTLMNILAELLPDSLHTPKNGSERNEPESTHPVPQPASCQTAAPENDTSRDASSDTHQKDDVWDHISKELAHLLKAAVLQTLNETSLLQPPGRVLSGDIRYLPVTNVIKLAGMSNISGRLSVLTDRFSSEMYLDAGQIVFASMTGSSGSASLERLLCKNAGLQPKDVTSCLAEAQGSCLAAGGLLLQRGLLGEEELCDAFSSLTDEALNEILSAPSGHFTLEDVPLPDEIQKMRLVKKAG